MASDTDICNLALGHIGNRARLTSLDPPDASVEGKQCSTFYPVARDIALESGPHWRFSKTRVALASLTAPADGEWSFAYALPTKFVKALKIVPPGADKDHPGEDYVMESIADSEGNFDDIIYTDVEEAVMHYIYRETNAGRYSPLFVSALSWLLASFIAGPIIKGRTGVQAKESAYKVYLSELAKAKASQLNQRQESTEYKGHEAPWISDR